MTLPDIYARNNQRIAILNPHMSPISTARRRSPHPIHFPSDNHICNKKNKKIVIDPRRAFTIGILRIE